MKSYLLTIPETSTSFIVIKELERIGTLIKVSDILNIYQLTTNETLEKIAQIKGVINVRTEGYCKLN